MAKLTKAKIREFIKDEKIGARDYRKYGLSNLARDEARHRRILMKRLRKEMNR
jgi:hypothetical protein